MRFIVPRRLRGRRPSPSMVVACLALFVALGGTATAAVVIRSSKQIKSNVIRSSDIRNGQVKTQDLRDDAVTSSKVDNGSLSLDDLQSSARSAIQAAGTQALEAYRVDGPNGVAASQVQRVATLSNIPPGVYAIFAKTILTGTAPRAGLLSQGETMAGHCELDAGGDVDHGRALLGTPGGNSPGTITTQITRTFSETSEASLSCDVQDATWKASNTSIIALRLGSANRRAVTE